MQLHTEVIRLVLKKTNWKWLALGVFFVALGAVISNRFEGKMLPSELLRGSTLPSAPQFELPDAESHLVRLENFQGSVVILHFWASWCPPCLGEIPQWVELGTYFKGKPVKLVAISQDESWKDANQVLLPRVLSSHLISLLDAPGKVSSLYGTFQFPETYLIGPDQKIVMKWVGPQDWSNQEIREAVNRVLKLTAQ